MRETSELPTFWPRWPQVALNPGKAACGTPRERPLSDKAQLKRQNSIQKTKKTRQDGREYCQNEGLQHLRAEYYVAQGLPANSHKKAEFDGWKFAPHSGRYCGRNISLQISDTKADLNNIVPCDLPLTVNV